MTWFLFWIGVNFLIGYAIGKPKDQAVSSALICVLLGPIGWIICALSSGKTRQCPYCAERVKASATVCRYCHRDLGAPDKEAFSGTLIMVWAGGLTVFVCSLVFIWLAFRYSWRVHEPERQVAVGTAAASQTVAMPASTGAPSLEKITLAQPVIVQALYGSTTLPVGTEVELVSQDASNAHIRYAGRDLIIPSAAIMHSK
jgi:hypothetical protein